MTMTLNDKVRWDWFYNIRICMELGTATEYLTKREKFRFNYKGRSEEWDTFAQSEIEMADAGNPNYFCVRGYGNSNMDNSGQNGITITKA